MHVANEVWYELKHAPYIVQLSVASTLGVTFLEKLLVQVNSPCKRKRSEMLLINLNGCIHTGS